MKKALQIFWIILIFLVVFFSLNINCVKATNITGIFDGVKDFEIAGQIKVSENNGEPQIEEQELIKISNLVYNILLIIGIVVAVIIGVIIAIKFMIGSVNQKAELKSTIIAYIVGCIIIFGAFGIWKIVVTNLNQAFPEVTEEEIKKAQQERENSIKNANNNSANNNNGSTSNNSSGSSSSTSNNSNTNGGSSNSKNDSNSSDGNKKEDKEKKNVSTLLDTISGYSQQIENDYKNKKYWEYSNNKGSLGEKPTHNSFKDSLNGNRTTNCARIVFWAFYDMGITTEKEDIFSNTSGELKAKESTKNNIKKHAQIIRVNKTPNQLKREGNLKPGDICLYPGHTNIYIGNGKWYDAGRESGIGNAYSYKTVNGNKIYRFKTVGPCNSAYVNRTATYIIRLKDQT